MANNAPSQAGSGNRHAQRGLHPGFSVIILGCALTLVSFFFLDWNTSVLDLAFSSSSHSFSSFSRFINGPGVFQTLTSFDAVPAKAALWIWMVPVAAVGVLVFACAARYCNVRLLPLVALPAGVGFTLLTRFALTGEGRWGYTNIGYWLAVLGFFLVLVSGFWLRKASLIGGPVSEGYLAAQAWCAIAGGSLVCLSFFSPLAPASEPVSSLQSFYLDGHVVWSGGQRFPRLSCLHVNDGTESGGRHVPLFPAAVSPTHSRGLLVVVARAFGGPAWGWRCLGEPAWTTYFTLVLDARLAPSTPTLPVPFEAHHLEIAWSPDGKRWAVLHQNTGVKVWEVSSRKLLLTYVGSGGSLADWPGHLMEDIWPRARAG